MPQYLDSDFEVNDKVLVLYSQRVKHLIVSYFDGRLHKNDPWNHFPFASLLAKLTVNPELSGSESQHNSVVVSSIKEQGIAKQENLHLVEWGQLHCILFLAEETTKEESKDVEMKEKEEEKSTNEEEKAEKEDKEEKKEEEEKKPEGEEGEKKEESDKKPEVKEKKTEEKEGEEKEKSEVKKEEEKDKEDGEKKEGDAKEEDKATVKKEGEGKEGEKKEEESTQQKFMFNIADGGFTELHTLWANEQRALQLGREHEVWHRRHDYWLLTGIVTYPF